MSGSSAASSRIHWSGVTDRGRVRAKNEDAFLALALGAEGVQYLGKTGEAPLETADYLFAVSDGMGGARAGEFASRIAVDKIAQILPRSFRFAAQRLTVGFQDVLAELFHTIHNEMNRLGRAYPECAGMGCTLTLAWVVPGSLRFAHIGDSRLYRWSPAGGLSALTHDDTHVGWLRRQGQINEREARFHPRRHALSRALGAGLQFADPQIGLVEIAPGDRFLLCSDGVIDGLWDHALADLLASPDPPDGQPPLARRIVEAAVAESGRDNTTAVALSFV